ncbi:MAG: multidrug efflux MFS transporter [Novosphingobium sp.]|nr:multidrug efflux MFS transporter [Novosphingobium sp.]
MMGGQTTDVASLPVENHGLVIFGVMLASLLQILDTTIANVAIPHMQSALGATPESVTWVLTSYIIASAIATPLTGWLSDRIGGRQLFLISIATFIFSSVLCGLAQNLEQMVFFRILQGIFGAFMAPLSQSFMLDTTKPSRHATVMSIWSTGMMLGPVIGPFVGGWLTENWNWRFVFYINLPVGLIAFLILLTQLPDRKGPARKFDLFGFVWLSLALAALQLLLDRGNHIDWYDSGESWIYTGLAICAGWITAIHFKQSKNPLLNLELFKDRNFALATSFMIILGAILFSTLALIPPMMQNLLGYTVMGTGLVLMPRGLGSVVSTQVGGLLTRRGVDLRIVMGSGMLFTAVSLREMARWSLDVDATTIIVTSFVQGLGFGLVFIPINILAFSTLPPSQRTEASSIMNLFRGVGSSIGISVVTVALARNMQISHADIAGHITGQSGGSLIDVSSLDRLQSLGDAAMSMVNAEVTRQAAMVAYVDDYYLMFWATLIMVPLLIFLKPPSKPA